jgi:hypothetical protein
MKELKKIMRKVLSIIILGILIMSNAAIAAAEGPMEKFVAKSMDKVEQNCTKDLETYCQNVTPGEDREVACLYAYSDKISTPCLTALYVTQGEFKNAVDNLDAFIADCRPDILKLCSKVAIGEGRILACLEENKDKVAVKCRENLKNAHGDLGKEHQIAS